MIKIKKTAWNEYALIAGILILLICFFFWPIVSGKRTLFPILPGVTLEGPYGYQGEGRNCVVDPTSYLWIEVPLTMAASKMVRSGIAPFWNPYAGCGAPMSANLMAGLYNPFKSFLLLLNTPAFFDAYLLMRIFLAGLFTFMFLRKINISKISALVAAIAYMFSGYFMCYLTLWHLNADMLIPLLLFVFESNVQGKKGKHTFFSGAVVAMVILAGSPQCALLSLSFASLYFFYRIFNLYGTKIKRDALLQRTVSLVFILCIGLALSAFMLMDFYQLYRLGMHQVSIISEFDLMARMNHYSPRSLVSFLFSPLQFLGTSLWRDLPNLSRFSNVFVFPYIGIITLLLSIMSVSKDRKLNRLSLFFIIFSCLLIINILGGIIWLNQLLGDLILPLTRFFWAKYLGTFYFSIAVLAGLGFENIQNKNLLPKWVTFFVCCIFLFVLICFVANPAYYKNTFELATLTAGRLSLLLLPVKYPLSVRAVSIAIVFLSMTAFLYRFRRTSLYFLIVVMMLVELYIYHQPAYAVRHNPYAPSPYIEYLLQEKKIGPPFRICGFKGEMIPQISSAFGLEDVNNIDAIYITRYHEFMVNLILKTPFHYSAYSLTPTEKEEIGSKYLDLLNVKYIISTDSIDSDKFSLVYDDKAVKVYRNNTVMPRAFIVHRAEKIFNKDKIFARLRDSRFDFRMKIIIEKDLPEDMLSCNNSPLTDGSSVKIVNYKPNRVDLEATMENDGFLVLSDTYYPNWRAFVDEHEVEIYPTDYMLRSLYLTKGSHKISFVYDILPFKTGLLKGLN